jgi:hypothetical protein
MPEEPKLDTFWELLKKTPDQMPTTGIFRRYSTESLCTNEIESHKKKNIT